MQKQLLFKWVSLLFIFALVLTACANEPAGQVQMTPAAETPLVGDEEGSVPDTGEQAAEDAQNIIASPVLVFVSEVIGTRVVDLQGNDLGDIIDLAYDDHNGIVVYAILSAVDDSDAPLARQVAFPWNLLAHPAMLTGEPVENTLQRGSMPDSLVFNADQQVLRDSPSLQTDQLAEADFALWSEELYYYWRDALEGFHIIGVSDSTVLQRMSGLEHVQVIRGETGEVLPARDVVLDMGTGNMLYIVVEAGDLLPGDEGLLMVPYEYLRYGAMEDGTVGYVFNETEDTLRTFPRLEVSDLPSEE
jgi:hypothetical protein